MGRLSRVDAQCCELEVGAPRHEALACHLAMLGVEFSLIEPPELVEHVRQLALRLSAATGGRNRRRGANATPA